jgi:hypothetical protein
MMQPGKYYIGDLCYVLHNEWDEFCSLTIVGDKVLDGEFNLKDGRRFATFTTKWGDGNYFDQNGKSYDVDAGLIGCIRLDDIDLTDPDNSLIGGQVVEFIQPFSTFSAGGEIRIGNVLINTDPVEELEEEEEEEY